uniref:C2 domain-containing protein 2 n=2 Tax=Cacopsylla melanoneura TaxID=428564 RepID=A0A8D9EYW3_9HEMI
MLAFDAKHIWAWLTAAWDSMADLADKIDDLICSFEGGGDNTMDTIAMYLFIWMLFGLLVLGIGRYVYSNFISSKQTKPPTISDSAVNKVVEPKIIPSAVNKDLKLSSAPLSSPNRTVPATPPVRRRLNSKSGRTTPTLTRSRSLQSLSIPTATGPETESVRWVNQIFSWLYSDMMVVNELLNVWITALNETMKTSVAEHGLGVELVRILTETTQSPTINNIFCECDSKDDVTITCDCDATPAMQLKAFRQKGDKVDVSHYRVNVNKFRARLNILCITEQLKADVRADGWPEIKVMLAPVGTIKNPGLDESQMQDVITDIITNALRTTEVHLNLFKYASCPRLKRYQEPAASTLPLHYDSMMTHFNSIPPPSHSRHSTTSDKRLLVKVLKASDLGLKKGCQEPYCVIEVDDPPQKNQTAVKVNTNSPMWDEHFLFDVTSSTLEVLFEVYDRVGSGAEGRKFLGLAIVSVEELLLNPSQRQVIALQARPYEQDPVSGTITVEFLFIEGSEMPGKEQGKPYKLKETKRAVSPSGRVTTTTKTIYAKPGDYSNDHMTNGNGVAESALRDLRRNQQQQLLNNNNNVINKSTLTIHSVQRPPPMPYQTIQVEINDSGIWHEVKCFDMTSIPIVPPVEPEPSPTDEPVSAPEQNTEERGPTDHLAPPRMDFSGTAPLHGSQYHNQQLSGPGYSGTETDGAYSQEERGRSRGRRRDFFRTIKNRLARSRTRSKSMDDPNQSDSTANQSDLDPYRRSASADRTRDPSAHSTVGPLREGSARSSLSEASGVSGASTRTYYNEASTLVLETLENGVKKHYLIPLSLAQKNRWSKKGTKLHIFNDHTFIAKHLPGGTVCQMCCKPLARRLGKQGYECRDCHVKCHKQCHVRTETTCPHSTIQHLELSQLPVLTE